MQLSLFEPPPFPRQKRRTYTMEDFRTTRTLYTHGWFKGRQMAQQLGIPYTAFRKFVIRNPDLSKRRTKESP